MRVGKNPFKGASGEGMAYTGKEVTVAMLTFIPNFMGYYRERFELLKLCLESMIAHTPADQADVLVFDNGSCPEVTTYLQKLLDDKKITYLILSQHNLGYNGALNWIYKSCSSPYLSYADDDVFFHPDWLPHALEVFDHFPSIGMVSCSPTKTKFEYHHVYSRNLANLYPDRMQVLDHAAEHWNDAWDESFFKSVGNLSSPQETLGHITVPVFESEGVRCYPVSNHFHYVLNRAAIDILYPYPVGDLMSSNYKNPAFNMSLLFDEKLEENKLAKVSTYGMYAEHLGNVWSERAEHLKNTHQLTGPKAKVSNTAMSITWKKRVAFKIMNLPFVSKLLYRLYEKLFDLIHSKSLFDKQKQRK
jgi:glycosyltransferase involved in cell wall biosynthesis